LKIYPPDATTLTRNASAHSIPTGDKPVDHSIQAYQINAASGSGRGSIIKSFSKASLATARGTDKESLARYRSRY